jgi:hypothetical protein
MVMSSDSLLAPGDTGSWRYFCPRPPCSIWLPWSGQVKANSKALLLRGKKSVGGGTDFRLDLLFKVTFRCSCAGRQERLVSSTSSKRYRTGLIHRKSRQKALSKTQKRQASCFVEMASSTLCWSRVCFFLVCSVPKKQVMHLILTWVTASALRNALTHFVSSLKERP